MRSVRAPASFLASIVCGCVATDVPARPNGTEPETVEREYPIRVKAPDPPTSSLGDTLDDLAAWDLAGSDVRRSIASAVAAATPGVAFVELRSFECGRQ